MRLAPDAKTVTGAEDMGDVANRNVQPARDQIANLLRGATHRLGPPMIQVRRLNARLRSRRSGQATEALRPAPAAPEPMARRAPTRTTYPASCTGASVCPNRIDRGHVQYGRKSGADRRCRVRTSHARSGSSSRPSAQDCSPFPSRSAHAPFAAHECRRQGCDGWRDRGAWIGLREIFRRNFTLTWFRESRNPECASRQCTSGKHCRQN